MRTLSQQVEFLKTFWSVCRVIFELDYKKLRRSKKVFLNTKKWRIKKLKENLEDTNITIMK